MPADLSTEPSLAPRELRVGRLIDQWTWIAGLGIAAAALGFLLSAALRPEYEAAAVLSIGVDYPRTPPLDVLSESRVLDRVATLLTSDGVAALVSDSIDPAQARSTEDLRVRLRLDRRGSEWWLVGRGESPEAAAALANVWMEVSLAELDQAMDHAWKTLELQSAPIVAACSEMSEGASTEFVFTCLSAGPSLPPDQVDQLRRELALSHGILPIISYEAASVARPPATPVVWDRGPLIFGAAVAGMMAGAILAVVWPASGPMSPGSQRKKVPGESGRS